MPPSLPLRRQMKYQVYSDGRFLSATPKKGVALER